jgi:hypothetical protein
VADTVRVGLDRFVLDALGSEALEELLPDAPVWGSPEEPRVPIDAGVEIGYRDTGEEVHDRWWSAGIQFAYVGERS